MRGPERVVFALAALREAGEPAFLHMAGIVHVVDGQVEYGRIIRNRLDLARRLAKA